MGCCWPPRCSEHHRTGSKSINRVLTLRCKDHPWIVNLRSKRAMLLNDVLEYIHDSSSLRLRPCWSGHAVVTSYHQTAVSCTLDLLRERACKRKCRSSYRPFQRCLREVAESWLNANTTASFALARTCSMLRIPSGTETMDISVIQEDHGRPLLQPVMHREAWSSPHLGGNLPPSHM
ncbi:hypothetical protein BC834DRAFT_115127 [Gloeopeniophorella convolvens]|nr:hypothetical protein BC834DRAFT_115127 [Gloeopeniophorella convolvens]